MLLLAKQQHPNGRFRELSAIRRVLTRVANDHWIRPP
jgi:hypothetical protein